MSSNSPPRVGPVPTAYQITKAKNFLQLDTLLFVYEKKENDKPNLNELTLQYYKNKCTAFLLNKRPEEGFIDGMIEDDLLKTTATGEVYLTGSKIWHTTGRLKRTIVNLYIPAWNRQFNSDGSIPSGKIIKDLLLGTLKTLDDDKEVESRSVSTASTASVTNTENDISSSAAPVLATTSTTAGSSSSTVENPAPPATAARGQRRSTTVRSAAAPSEPTEPNDWHCFILRGPPAKLYLTGGGSPDLYKINAMFDLVPSAARPRPIDGGSGSRSEQRRRSQEEEKSDRNTLQQAQDIFSKGFHHLTPHRPRLIAITMLERTYKTPPLMVATIT